MKLIRPYYEVQPFRENALETIETYGRTCYKSEEKKTSRSAEPFIKMLVDRGHLSVVEHVSMTVKFTCDRGVSHELVRHRLASYSQESTRYCNYGVGVTFIKPLWITAVCGHYDRRRVQDLLNHPSYPQATYRWLLAMLEAEEAYVTLIDSAWTPQQARSVLPNALKTEIVMTANLREWMHVFELRTNKVAHPQMRELMVPLLIDFRKRVPIIFDKVGNTDKEML